MNSMPNSPKPLMTQKSLREPVTDGNMLTDSGILFPHRVSFLDQPPKTMIMDYNPSMMEIERDPNIDKLIFQEDDLELKVNRTVDGDLRYLYKGPKNYVITLLLEDLHEINKPLPKLLRIIRRFNQRIDSWFEKRDCCPEHQGVLTFNKDSIIALTIMLIFTIVFSVEVTVHFCYILDF